MTRRKMRDATSLPGHLPGHSTVFQGPRVSAAVHSIQLLAIKNALLEAAPGIEPGNNGFAIRVGKCGRMRVSAWKRNGSEGMWRSSDELPGHLPGHSKWDSATLEPSATSIPRSRRIRNSRCFGLLESTPRICGLETAAPGVPVVAALASRRSPSRALGITYRH